MPRAAFEAFVTAAPAPDPRSQGAALPELAGERLISRPEREVLDQLGAGRFGKPPQLRQLIA